MSAVSSESVPAPMWRRWRDPAAWSTSADIFAILIAASLPWSTTLVAIFAGAFLVSVARFLDVRVFLQLLKRPICVLPVALFALALVGTLWSHASWGGRLHAVGQSSKLLMLPVLLYHFGRSARGLHVMIGFLVSCVLLMLMSFIVAFDPRLGFKMPHDYGVAVKNYIDQSQEFALCAVVLAYPVIALWRAQKAWPAALLLAVSLSFAANMLFIVVSRTALVTMPIMLAVFGVVHLRLRTTLLILCAAAIAGVIVWTASPQLERTVDKFQSEYQAYMERGTSTSIGERLEFYRKSVRFFAQAPIFGHGTGSIRELFEQAAIDQRGAAAEVIANPHNQTLSVAVQWGAVGIVVLYAMWLVHLMLFRGDGLATWIGLMVVVQNFFTSLFNSHIFDFNEGWIYVLGVGVAGGMVLRGRLVARADAFGVC